MPNETIKYLYLFKVNVLHGKFLEQRSSLGKKNRKEMLISHIVQHNHKVIRDDIVKHFSIERVFIFLLSEIIKCVESGKNERLCTDK